MKVRKTIAAFVVAVTTLTAVLLGGCAATRMVYQRLDWFATWRLGDYVSLNDRQTAQFKREFADVWSWHRREELPLYARDLREIAARLDAGELEPGSVAAWSQRAQEHWERTMVRTVGSLCGVVRTLDDRQVRDILDGIDEDIEDFAEEFVEPSREEVRRDSRKRTARWIKRWTGTLNGEQETLLAEWARERRDVSEAWLGWRRQWRAQLAGALAARRGDAACDTLQPLFATPMDLRSAKLRTDLAHNEALWAQLIADVAGRMDERQRSHARAELLRLAGQFEELAAIPQRGAPSRVSTNRDRAGAESQG